MFVRLKQDRGQRETTFECVRATIEPVKLDNGGTGNEISITLIDHSGPVYTVDMKCDDLEIIFMNRHGETIDRKLYGKAKG